MFECIDIGRLHAVTDALGHTTTYGYDELGNRTSITDALSHATRFEHDRLGRMTKRTLPLLQYETMSYDAMGNLVAKTDFNGHTTTYAYDQQNRMISRTFPGESAVSFSYDALGRRLTAGGESFAYDDRGRMLSNTKTTGEVIAYTYDAAGNRTSIIDPHGTTSYAFDELNRVSMLTDPEGGVATYGYDAVGNVASIALPNGVLTTKSYDELNHLTRIESRNTASTVLAAYAYAPSATGHLQGVVEEHSGRTVVWGYDAIYRLTSEAITDAVNGNRATTYTYDAVGNRSSKIDSIDATTTYTYDANDRLFTETSSAGTTTYGFDENGNQTSKSNASASWTYTYDARNLLAEAVTGLNVYAYEYDVDGSRTAKVLNGVSTNYLVDRNWPNAQVIREIDNSGVETAHHVFGREELISSTVPNAGQLYMLYDAQRSVRQHIDSNGETVDAIDFAAFGKQQSGISSSTHGYAAEMFDAESGLIYLRARQYDPATGRFLETDPVARTASPRSNFFSYAEDDPINMHDPSGLFGEVVLGADLSQPSFATILPSLLGADAGAHVRSVRRQVMLATATIKVEAALAVMSGPSLDAYQPYFDSGRTPLSAGDIQINRDYVRETWTTMLRASVAHHFIYVDGRNICQVNRNAQGAFAFTRSTNTDEIWFCDEFFDEVHPRSSQAQILLHEMTHSTLRAEDEVSQFCSFSGNQCYGLASAMALAEHAPTQAVSNADNYVWAASEFNSELGDLR